MIHLDFAYEVDDDEAFARLEALADYWAARHGVVARWQGREAHFDGKIFGVRYEGRASVGGRRVVAAVKAGFLAEKLGAKPYVERKLTEYLDPRRTLAELRARVPQR